MAARERGASHTRKLAKGRKRGLTDRVLKHAIADHLKWLEHGGARQYEKDFTAAPIALRYGMPYRSPLSPQDVARLRGNSHGDGSEGGKSRVLSGSFTEDDPT